jgi:hypothetical protein
MGVSNMNVDFTALLNTQVNAELLKDKKSNKITKVCNKYGIFGLDIVNFLAELASAQQYSEGEVDE